MLSKVPVPPNCTLVELKYYTINCNMDEFETPNCTLVELKSYR